MKKLMCVSVLVVCIISFIGLFIPLAAQENGDGTIVYGTANGSEADFTFLVPCHDNKCEFMNFVYVSLLGIDPEIGWFAPNQPRSLVESWEFADSNQVLILHLRDDLYWSDDTPITAADVMMSYELGLNPATNRGGEVGVQVASATVENVEMLDEHTIRISFTHGSCQALYDVADFLFVAPAHIFRQLIDKVGYENLRNHELLQQPTVVSGPFRPVELSANRLVRLQRNTNYRDNALGYVRPAHFEALTVTADTPSVTTFLSGEINVIDYIHHTRRQEYITVAASGALQVYQYPENNYTSLVLNLADPNNPQPALDENGQRVNQGLHPIFGDKLVRQAIAHALDVDGLITEALAGFATRIPTNIIPNSWAYNNNLRLVPYDRQLALTMLAQAGWIPENSALSASPSNRLICRDCLYAREIDATFNGSYMEIELLRYGNRAAPINMIAEQLQEIGVSVHLRDAEFDEVVESLIGQTFDAVYMSIFGSYPYNPATDGLFGPLADEPGVGLNFTSFYNEAYFALEATANSIPGCGLTERANIYRQMQEIIYDEQPYIFLYANMGMYVAKNEVEGFAPYPNNLFWNVDTWVVHENQ